MKKRTISLAAVCCLFTAHLCLAQGNADTILYNGKVLTVDAQSSVAEAVAVSGDRILAVGTNQEVLELAGPDTLQIDLKGRTVTPGLIHTHVHMESPGRYGRGLPASQSKRYPLNFRIVKTKEDVIKQVKDTIEAFQFEPGEWIQFSTNPSGEQARLLFDELNRWELYKGAPDNPIFFSLGVPILNMVLVNSKAIEALWDTQVLTQPEPKMVESAPAHGDLRDIKGQETAKRALEVAAAGGHNLLMIGPPGAGKSMLAARLPELLPPLDASETLEVSMIASVAGYLPEGGLTRRRPFRDPHHTASNAAMIGGGTRAKPGEVSLAHLGVLFLDELPEFPRQVLESLRQPMETGRVTVARANAHVTYPARIQVVAAMNPCRCGYLSDPEQACNRVPRCAIDYQARISGPLFDRIDLHVDVPPLSAGDLTLPPPAEGSAEIGARVAAARAIQAERYAGVSEGTPIRTNAEADGELLLRVAGPDDSGRALLGQAVDRLKLSARGYHRVLRVARTLVDLEGGDGVRRHHIAEALSYRRIHPRAAA